MVFIKRDEKGQICAIYNQQTPTVTEQADIKSTELADFLISCDKESYLKFLQSDLEFIRVIEDVIVVLIEKNLITLTDFPPTVIDKLLTRQSVRNKYEIFSNESFGSNTNISLKE